MFVRRGLELSEFLSADESVFRFVSSPFEGQGRGRKGRKRKRSFCACILRQFRLLRNCLRTTRVERGRVKRSSEIVDLLHFSLCHSVLLLSSQWTVIICSTHSFTWPRKGSYWWMFLREGHIVERFPLPFALLNEAPLRLLLLARLRMQVYLSILGKMSSCSNSLGNFDWIKNKVHQGRRKRE